MNKTCFIAALAMLISLPMMGIAEAETEEEIWGSLSVQLYMANQEIAPPSMPAERIRYYTDLGVTSFKQNRKEICSHPADGRMISLPGGRWTMLPFYKGICDRLAALERPTASSTAYYKTLYDADGNKVYASVDADGNILDDEGNILTEEEFLRERARGNAGQADATQAQSEVEQNRVLTHAECLKTADGQLTNHCDRATITTTFLCEGSDEIISRQAIAPGSTVPFPAALEKCETGTVYGGCSNGYPQSITRTEVYCYGQQRGAAVPLREPREGRAAGGAQ